MDAFREEVRGYSTEDLELIVADQKDFYTEEEFAILQAELQTRDRTEADRVKAAEYLAREQEGERLTLELEEERRALEQEEERRARAEEAARLAREREAARRQEIFKMRIASLKARGYDGYYEYMTLSLTDNNAGGIYTDNNAGGIYTDTIDNRLNDLALDGWRLVSSYANELGHNTTPGTAYSAGSNATIDQHILILERFVKI